MRPQRQPEAPMRVAVPKSQSLARGTFGGEGCGHVAAVAISKQTKPLKNMVEKPWQKLKILKLKLPVGTSHVVHGCSWCFFMFILLVEGLVIGNPPRTLKQKGGSGSPRPPAPRCCGASHPNAQTTGHA